MRVCSSSRGSLTLGPVAMNSDPSAHGRYLSSSIFHLFIYVFGPVLSFVRTRLTVDPPLLIAPTRPNLITPSILLCYILRFSLLRLHPLPSPPLSFFVPPLCLSLIPNFFPSYLSIYLSKTYNSLLFSYLFTSLISSHLAHSDLRSVHPTVCLH
ncbi:hypothetical protein SCHPADRAFT_621876 [Schizopora paradoxa]|uniref:Uncharacterized protein n=1 Tax=Schizopora paradoxa TaxID=27342 RepID=A0A0H2R8C8_9AGAM|nr:hypothetical protein SCHPADRAFT_621876 [Schizopora paradoxa]